MVLAIYVILTQSQRNERNRLNKLRMEADRLIARGFARPDPEAEVYLAQAYALALQAREGLLCSEAALKVGEIQMRTGNYEAAVEWFNKAMTAKRDPGWRGEHPNFERLISSSLHEAMSKVELSNRKK